MLYWNIPYPPEIAPIRMPDRVLAISVSAMCNILDIKQCQFFNCSVSILIILMPRPFSCTCKRVSIAPINISYPMGWYHIQTQEFNQEKLHLHDVSY